MRTNRKSMAQRYEERRSRRLINKAIAEAPSDSMRTELLVAAQRQLAGGEHASLDAGRRAGQQIDIHQRRAGLRINGGADHAHPALGHATAGGANCPQLQRQLQSAVHPIGGIGHHLFGILERPGDLVAEPHENRQIDIADHSLSAFNIVCPAFR